MIREGDTVYLKPGCEVSQDTGVRKATSRECAYPFTVERVWSCAGTNRPPRACLIANGYGDFKGDYGNGPLYVDAKDLSKSCKVGGTEVKGYDSWSGDGSSIEGGQPTEEMFNACSQRLLAGTDFDPNLQ